MPLSNQTFPTTDVDLFDPAVSLEPFDEYRRLRDQGSVVWNTRHEYWTVTRYDEVKSVLQNHEDFISGKGAAHENLFMEAELGKQVLISDPPDHTRFRAVLNEKLRPPRARALRETIKGKVDALLDEALASGTLDGVPAIAQAVPTKVVGDLVGLPEEGRPLLLHGADAIFRMFAPLSPFVQAGLPDAEAYFVWAGGVAQEGNFAPDSWGEALYRSYSAGEISMGELLAAVQSILVAGLDTTVNSIGTLLRLFAERPDVWRALQDDPSRAAAVFEEALRYQPPLMGFFRRAARDVEFAGTGIAEGDRVLVVYASANHDERHYPDPESFSIDRNPVDHLAMGNGIHACVGGALARVEASAVIASLLERVETFELAGEPVRRYHPVLRGHESLPLKVTLKTSVGR